MHPLRIPATILLTQLLFGCASPELLQPYAANSSANISLAGNWVLRGDGAAIARELNRAIRETDGVRDNVYIAPPPGSRGRNGASSDGRISGGIVYVFFKNGDALKISQTPYALFVSFDRAIVEEYRFGEWRKINVGQAEAQRASGWDGSDYVIDTLDRNGMKLSERYKLSADRETLTRHITFRGKNNKAASVSQSFVRVD